MPRGLTPAQKAEIKKRVFSPAHFVEIGLSPNVRAWTGIGTANVGGKTWLGVHEFAAISGLESTGARKLGGVTLSLVGIPAQFVDNGVIEATRAVQYQGKAVNIYLGFCDTETGRVKQDVGLALIWSGYVDVLLFRLGSSISATLACDHFSTRLARPNGLRMTSESHNARLGNPATKDLFFEPQNRLMGRPRPAMK